MSVGTIIMLGAQASSEPEELVLAAQRASTLDLIKRVQANLPTRLIISSPEFEWFPKDIDAVLVPDDPDQPFHFGRQLAEMIETQGVDRLLYFGGGSAPLVDNQMMGMLAGLLVNAGSEGGLARIPSHIVLTNNRHSSDWVAISHLDQALPTIRAAKRDNSLAWALQETGEYEVRVLAGIRPAASMDIDTPADLSILRQHPDVSAHLESVLSSPQLDALPTQEVVEVLRREGSQVAIVGRVSPLAWQAVSKATRCWIRVYAEERGMVASDRLARGEVRSMLGKLLHTIGAEAFFKWLEETVDAAVFDSRVLMAHALGTLPARKDRFASDMYQVDLIENDWLRQFTKAARDVAIPVLLGGHNVVSGGLYALAEIIEKDY